MYISAIHYFSLSLFSLPYSRTGSKQSTTEDADAAKPVKTPNPVEHLTHLASTLMSFGDVDIYSKTYEELVRSVRRSGKVDDSWDPPSADVKYEYKWDVPGSTGQDGEVFGPFSEEEVQSWYKAAYFGISGEKVKIRTVGGEWGAWDDIIS
jgi:CD2 antigen cytoplasmic tail-binding protein 2